MRFDTSWVHLVIRCVHLVKYLVVVNKEARGIIVPTRRLRQDKGVKVSHSGPRVSYLLFADNSLVFGVTSIEEAGNMVEILKEYEQFSGQQFNFGESLVYFSSNVNQGLRQVIADKLGIQSTIDPGNYLGLSLVVRGNRKRAFHGLRDRFLDIWATKGLLQIGCGWHVGNGHSISVLEDVWLPRNRPCKIQTARVSGIDRVADLIDDNQRQWNMELFRTSFTDHEVEQILSIPLASCALDDRWKWYLEESGEYTVCSGYRLLLRGFPMTDGDRDCPGVLDVWQQLRITWTLLDEMVDVPIVWIGQPFSNDAKQTQELDSLPRECCLSETVALGIWKPPFEPWVQVNFDVGFYGHLQAASAGVVVIYLEGLLLGSVCFWSEYVLDVVVAEALACVHAIRFARDLGLRRVEFEGDSAVVISKLKSGVIDRSNISGYIWVAVDSGGVIVWGRTLDDDRRSFAGTDLRRTCVWSSCS
ncbi:hypothetical protein CXB51_008189 [Gossypium anomalum]|uniref:RNase H type-1 domain-containing protein n=1 Tax=Gossypium anomalum TaxID=47600 RepID=A0A8J6D7W0_9ROSI|nr:hypothetical protein CXB51_008189 [Gossypium anomalum]